MSPSLEHRVGWLEQLLAGEHARQNTFNVRIGRLEQLAQADTLNPLAGHLNAEGRWVNEAGGGTPSGPAGGSLTGEYPDPTVKNGTIGEAQLTEALKTKVNEKASGLTKAEAEGLLLEKGLNASGTNTMIGHGAGANLEGLSSQNTALGYEALGSAKGQADYNTAIGYRAMASFVGHKGGENAGAEGYNVAIGTNAGHQLTVGSGHVLIGDNAGGGLTTGEECVVIGCEAYGGNATGGVAVGFRALNSNSTGTPVLAIGYQAAAANTTGAYILAIGTDALATNSTGSHLLAIGHNTLEKATGSGNLAIGDSALRNTTTGSENVAVGYTALSQLTTGEENAAFGYGAGYYATGKSSQNIFIGPGAGPAANSEVNHQLYINSTPSAAPLIGGNFETKTVQVNGRLEPEHLAIPLAAPAELILENGKEHAALSAYQQANVTLILTLKSASNKACGLSITVDGKSLGNYSFVSNGTVSQTIPVDFMVGPGQTFTVGWSGETEKVEAKYQLIG